MVNELLAIAIKETPAAIALIRSAFAKAHPTAPEPTDEEILAAYHEAVAQTLAKADAWLAAHPKTPPTP